MYISVHSYFYMCICAFILSSSLFRYKNVGLNGSLNCE